MVSEHCIIARECDVNEDSVELANSFGLEVTTCLIGQILELASLQSICSTGN